MFRNRASACIRQRRNLISIKQAINAQFDETIIPCVKRDRDIGTPKLEVNTEDMFVRHMYFHKNDKERIMELEKWRISMRHLANIMGEDPKTFNYEKQKKALNYLMPGYSLYGEGNPLMEHPHEWMKEYAPKSEKNKTKCFEVIQGRPTNTYYFTKEPNFEAVKGKIGAAVYWCFMNEQKIYRDRSLGKLSSSEARILLSDPLPFSDILDKRDREGWSLQKFEEELSKMPDKLRFWSFNKHIYPRANKERLTQDELKMIQKLKHDFGPLGSMYRNEVDMMTMFTPLGRISKYEERFARKKFRQNAARANSSPLANALPGEKPYTKAVEEQQFKRAKDYYAGHLEKHINILGIDFYDRECSTVTNVWKGKTTVNCTMVKHGSGLIEVNGVKLQSFFSHDADCCLKALSPLYLIGKLTSYDAMISVTGYMGGPEAVRKPKGREFQKPTYGRYNNYAYPQNSPIPKFDFDHRIAAANGGKGAAAAIAKAIAEALVPLCGRQEQRILIQSGLMIQEVRQKEREWKAGAGTLRIRGRRSKIWKRR